MYPHTDFKFQFVALARERPLALPMGELAKIFDF